MAFIGIYFVGDSSRQIALQLQLNFQSVSSSSSSYHFIAILYTRTYEVLNSVFGGLMSPNHSDNNLVFIDCYVLNSKVFFLHFNLF